MIKIQLALQAILEMARSHVEDIESGLEEGLYELKDNEDLSTKKAAIEEVAAYLRERSASLLIPYCTDGDPTETGIYACRAPMSVPGFFEDLFLLWIDGEWAYPGSDQKYRGRVTGWVGPLQRKMPGRVSGTS